LSEFTVLDFGLAILLTALIVRMAMIALPAFKFAMLFKGKIIEGTNLYKAMEIPGLNQFLKQEIFLGFLPYLALAMAIFFQRMQDVFIADLGLGMKVITGIGLGAWLVIDWIRSYTINRQLEMMRSETETLRTITGSVLDGLRYVVYLRGTVKRTAFELGKRAAVGLTRKKLKEQEEKSGKKSLAHVAMMAVERLISFPERVVGRIAEWAKDSLDEKFAKRFEGYSKRSRALFFLLIAWSLVPAVWLSLIVVMHGA
jgi:hypothetical protein